MGGLRNHAEKELKLLGYNLDGTDEDINKLFCDAVLELIDTFAQQGHSGFSAPHVVHTFYTLAKYELLSPLTGKDDEWNDVSEQNGKPLKQNNRDSRVFKEGDRAYFLDGKIFKDPDGFCYTNKDSVVDIEFPCMPKSEYIDVEKEKGE